jgi:hypothetical protein
MGAGMIYTRFGIPCKVIADHGEHAVRGTRGNVLMTLVSLEFIDDGDRRPRFYMAEALKASDGWKEIEQAVKHAPRVELAERDLQRALRAAR